MIFSKKSLLTLLIQARSGRAALRQELGATPERDADLAMINTRIAQVIQTAEDPRSVVGEK